MEMDLDTSVHLSYDDVLAKPQYSTVQSRSDVNTTSRLTPNHTIENPIVGAPMDTVTEAEMAQALSDAGSVGVLHRFYANREENRQKSIRQQADDVAQVDGLVGAAVGVGDRYYERADRVIDAGADFICLDIAHGHMQRALDAVSTLNESIKTPIVAGNVATRQGTIDLIEAGADSVKVGVGPGSHCLTREVAGVGVPQASAVHAAAEGRRQLGAETEVTIIADGGIQSGGDVLKATMLGADTVMIGGLFAGCDESPAQAVKIGGEKYMKTRGMSSDEAREELGLSGDQAAEGASGLTRYQGSAENVVEELSAGLRSGLSYMGGHSIEQARENAEIIRITPSTQARNGTHGVYNDN